MAKGKREHMVDSGFYEGLTSLKMPILSIALQIFDKEYVRILTVDQTVSAAALLINRIKFSGILDKQCRLLIMS